jgi:hypothetical protein
MLREQRKEIFREQQRQRMASLQAKGAAFDSPSKIDIGDVATQTQGGIFARSQQSSTAPVASQDLYAAALILGAAGQVDRPGNEISYMWMLGFPVLPCVSSNAQRKPRGYAYCSIALHALSHNPTRFRVSLANIPVDVVAFIGSVAPAADIAVQRLHARQEVDQTYR